MSTRAVYTFKDSDNTFHVYKHHDGYPSGAAEWITNALPYAWKLPRFEASEFACAFIAGNKDKDAIYQGGGVYLTHAYSQHSDLDYRYEITFDGKNLNVTAFELFYKDAEKLIFHGTLDDFVIFADKESE